MMVLESRIHKTVPLLEPTRSTCEDSLGDGSKPTVSLFAFDCLVGVVMTTARFELFGGVTNSSAANARPVETPSEPLSSRRLLDGVVERSYWSVAWILFGSAYLTAAAGDEEDNGLKTMRV